jgi:hypothetical protein
MFSILFPVTCITYIPSQTQADIQIRQNVDAGSFGVSEGS